LNLKRISVIIKLVEEGGSFIERKNCNLGTFVGKFGAEASRGVEGKGGREGLERAPFKGGINLKSQYRSLNLGKGSPWRTFNWRNSGTERGESNKPNRERDRNLEKTKCVIPERGKKLRPGQGG